MLNYIIAFATFHVFWLSQEAKKHILLWPKFPEWMLKKTIIGKRKMRVNHYDFMALHSMWRIF